MSISSSAPRAEFSPHLTMNVHLFFFVKLCPTATKFRGTVTFYFKSVRPHHCAEDQCYPSICFIRTICTCLSPLIGHGTDDHNTLASRCQHWSPRDGLLVNISALWFVQGRSSAHTWNWFAQCWSFVLLIRTLRIVSRYLSTHWGDVYMFLHCWWFVSHGLAGVPLCNEPPVHRVWCIHNKILCLHWWSVWVVRICFLPPRVIRTLRVFRIYFSITHWSLRNRLYGDRSVRCEEI